MLPNFLIIGAARCGTTWMWRNLRMHPQIFLPGHTKELHFFSGRYDRGLDWYEAQFGSPDERAVGEATPDYLYFPEAAARIFDAVPRARLIVSLRNPIDRAYSHYWNLVAKAKKGETNRTVSFEEKLELTPRLIQEGLYTDKLQRYFDIFPREQILVLRYDNLQGDPQEFLRTIYAFLSVSTDFHAPLATSRVNVSQLKLGRSRVFFHAYRMLLRLKAYGLGARLEQSVRKRPPAMRPETRERLLDEHYLKELERLETLLGWDLSSWREPPAEALDRVHGKT